MTTATGQYQAGKERKTMDSERYLNVDDVAALLGVARKTVYGWVYAKAIPHLKFSRSGLRFRASDIEAWAESRTVSVGSGGGDESQGNPTD